MTTTIAIANQKGGVGKTTTAVTLAHGLAKRDYRILLVDLDPQGQCATFLGLQQRSNLFDLLVSDYPLRDVTRSTDIPDHERPNLSIVPGNRRTATAEIVLTAEGVKLRRLAEALEDVDADFIIFDTSPSVGFLQESALYAADWLLVPTATDYPASEGLAGVLETLRSSQDQGAKCQLLGVLPTMYDEVTRESSAALEQLKESLGEAVLEPIHRATVLRECAAEGITIFEKSPGSRAAREYKALVNEVIKYA